MLAVWSRQAAKAQYVEDRRKAQRRKLYGHQYLAMVIGVRPEDRRQTDRRSQPASNVTPLHPAPSPDLGAEENAAS
jgi:hypothetical protein